jgi:acyl dehydratase
MSETTAEAYATITPEMLAAERARVGQRVGRPTPFVEVANQDAIRHWAHGIGDLNPLYTDEAYARASVHGDLLAPPSMVCALDKNVMGIVRGFPGTHAWDLGCAMEWRDHIKRDHAFDSQSWPHELKEARSSYAGGIAYDQTHRTELTDRSTGQVVCVVDNFVRRFERGAGQKSTKESSGYRQPSYSRAELDEIADCYESEAVGIRGAEPRFAEDVRPGDEVPRMARGPLSLMDCIAFVVGWGGSFLFAHGYAYRFWRRHPGAFPANEFGVPDSPERTHWDADFARSIGAAGAFDYGPQRVAWCATLLTNWMGDAGFLRRLNVRLSTPNYHGDVLWLSGQVTAVDAATGEVTIEITGLNQRDVLVCSGTATVLLPRRGAGPVELPVADA